MSRLFGKGGAHLDPLQNVGIAQATIVSGTVESGTVESGTVESGTKTGMSAGSLIAQVSSISGGSQTKQRVKQCEQVLHPVIVQQQF
nr:hypothetical protein BgiMline_028471 [Biomphalaria glabrata]